MPLGPSFTIEAVRRQALVIEFPAYPPVSVAGWTLAFFLSPSAGAALLLTKTAGAGLTVTSATTGVVEVALTRVDTTNLEARDYAVGLWRTDAGNERPLREGVLRVKEPVWLGP